MGVRSRPSYNIGKGEFSRGADWTSDGRRVAVAQLFPLLPFYFPNFFASQIRNSPQGKERNIIIVRSFVRLAAPMKSIEKSSVTRLGEVSKTNYLSISSARLPSVPFTIGVHPT